MLKNFSILILGILIGMASMFFIPKGHTKVLNDPTHDPCTGTSESEESVLEIDDIYDQLMQEKQAEPKVKHWFEQKLEKMDSEANEKMNEFKSEGDQAAKVFEQFIESE